MTSKNQINNNKFYVEAILDQRINLKGQIEYLIKWEDYAIEDATWEPSENLQEVKPLLEQFEKSKFNSNKEDFQMEEILDFLEEDRIPLKVLSIRMLENKLLCLCEFSESSTGIVPDACYVPNSVLREKFPKILIDYYESKITFVNRK